MPGAQFCQVLVADAGIYYAIKIRNAGEENFADVFPTAFRIFSDGRSFVVIVVGVGVMF